jgi:outer membrane protein TolC
MPRPFARAGLICLLCTLTPLEARLRADERPVPEFGESLPPIDLSGAVSLDNCVATALSRNFNVRIQTFTVSEASDAVDVQAAPFEPVIGFSADKQVAQQASSQLIYTVPYQAIETATLSLNDTLMTGGTVSLGYNLNRVDQNPAYTSPNPSFTGNASISVTQPLLSGAGIGYNRTGLDIAKLGVRISNLNFKSTVLTMILNVETTYYNLLYQREQYKVQEEELRQAQQLLDENTVRRQTGVDTDLDVMNARAGVASAKNQLILDRQAVHTSEDSLLQLLGDRAFSSAVGDVRFPDIAAPEVSFARSYKLARDNGPNLAVAAATIEQFKLSALKARRDVLPSLSVNGALGYGSFAGTASQSLTGNYSGYNWTAGLTLTIPWEMKAAKAQYHTAESQLRSQEVAYDQADQALMVNLRQAVRSVETSGASVQSSRENTEFATKAYELTKAQFDAGLATSYLVLQSQNTLETARVSELQAKVTLLQSIANLRFYEGSSLQLYRINLPE